MVQFENDMRLLSSLRVVLRMSVGFLQFYMVFKAWRRRSILFESNIDEIWFVKFDCFDLMEL